MASTCKRPPFNGSCITRTCDRIELDRKRRHSLHEHSFKLTSSSSSSIVDHNSHLSEHLGFNLHELMSSKQMPIKSASYHKQLIGSDHLNQQSTSLNNNNNKQSLMLSFKPTITMHHCEQSINKTNENNNNNSPSRSLVARNRSRSRSRRRRKVISVNDGDATTKLIDLKRRSTNVELNWRHRKMCALRPSRGQIFLLSVAILGLFALLVTCALHDDNNGNLKQLLKQQTHKQTKSSAWTAIVDAKSNKNQQQQQQQQHTNCSIFNNKTTNANCQTNINTQTTTTTTNKPIDSLKTTESGLRDLSSLIGSLEAPTRTTDSLVVLHVTEAPNSNNNNNLNHVVNERQNYSKLLSISGNNEMTIQQQQQQLPIVGTKQQKLLASLASTTTTTSSPKKVAANKLNGNINNNIVSSPTVNNGHESTNSSSSNPNSTQQTDPLQQSAASKSAGIFLASSASSKLHEQPESGQLSLIERQRQQASNLNELDLNASHFYKLQASNKQQLDRAREDASANNDNATNELKRAQATSNRDDDNNNNNDDDLIWHANQHNKANYQANQRRQQMLTFNSGGLLRNQQQQQHQHQPQLQATNIYSTTHLANPMAIPLNNNNNNDNATSFANNLRATLINQLIKRPAQLLHTTRAEARNEQQSTDQNQLNHLLPTNELQQQQQQQLNVALWQNVLTDALNQLINLSTSHQPNNPFKSADNQPLSQLTSLDQFNPSINQRQSITSLANDNWLNNNIMQQQFATDSNSAPSISLPPLSHFLIPRNPFKLFASTIQQNNPTRLRSNLFNMQAASSNKHVARPTAMPNDQYHEPQLVLIGNHQQQQQQQQQHQAASNHNDNYQKNQDFFGGYDSSFALPSDVMISSSGHSSKPIVYAHSHSVEQLEKLIKAASASTSSQMPSILPAIVSAPNGPIAGFYIPAIDGPTEPSSGANNNQNIQMSASTTTTHNKQPNRLNNNNFPMSSSSNNNNNNNNKLLMELNVPSASQVNQLASSLAISKIPGTDYILHPEEVRAMINIGELAWQKQLSGPGESQNTANSHNNQQSNHNSGSSTNQVNRFAPTGNNQNLQTDRFQDQQNRELNLMQENHAENARDFAYMEPLDFDRRPNNIGQQQHHHLAASSDQIATMQRQQQHHRPFSPSPAASSQPVSLIRLNRQHFMPWSYQLTPSASQQHHEQVRRPTTTTTTTTNNGEAIIKQQHPAIHFANPLNGKLTSAQPASELHGQRLLELAAVTPQIRIAQLQKSLRNNDQHLIGNLGTAESQLYQGSSNGGGYNQAQKAAPSSISSQDSNIMHNIGTDNTVRLATQLTPQEINLVEDSILEALLIAQHSIVRPQRLSPSNNLHIYNRHQSNNQRAPQQLNGNPIPLASKSQLHWTAPASSQILQHANNMNSGKQQQQANRKPYSWLESLKLRRRQSAKPTTTTTQATIPAENLGQLLASSSMQTGFMPIALNHFRNEPEKSSVHMSVVPLINVSSLTAGPLSQLTALNSMTSSLALNEHNIDDNLRDRMATKPVIPTLLADQETNKGVSSGSLDFAASEPSQTVMLVANTEPNDFGSRLASKDSTIHNTNKPITQPKLIRKVIKYHAQKPDSSEKQLMKQPEISTSNRNEDKMRVRDELYNVLIGNRSSRGSNGNGHRINVDWPPMTSDADYFPHSNTNNNVIYQQPLKQQQQHQNHAPQQLTLTKEQDDHDLRAHVASINDSKSTTTTTTTTIVGDVLSGQPTSLRAYQNNNNNNNNDDNLHRVHAKPQQQTHNDNNMLMMMNRHHSNQLLTAATSQVPKLQFAPDYQAREGVPIYNNNVRISGSLLARQKSNAD